jgi:hypothetical protein
VNFILKYLVEGLENCRAVNGDHHVLEMIKVALVYHKGRASRAANTLEFTILQGCGFSFARFALDGYEVAVGTDYDVGDTCTA